MAKVRGNEAPLHVPHSCAAWDWELAKVEKGPRRQTQAIHYDRQAHACHPILSLNSQQSNGHEAGSRAKHATALRAGQEFSAQDREWPKPTASQFLCLTDNTFHAFGTLLTCWLGFQMHHFLFPHKAASHYKFWARDSHMISSVSSKVDPGSPGAWSPEVSNVKALTTAAGSFDVGVIENKLTGEFVLHIVHFCS